jgi:hypothetical protein
VSRRPLKLAPAIETTTTMREALSDPALLGNVLRSDSWLSWRSLLTAANGEELTDQERVVFQALTARDSEPLSRVEELWVIAGRRGGKSRAAAVMAIYQAALVDHSKAIVIGERPVVLCLAQNQQQAGVVFGYVAGVFECTPMLARLVKVKTADTLSLVNGVDIVGARRAFVACAASLRLR